MTRILPIWRRAAVLAACLAPGLVASCASTSAAEAAREAAYQQCLEDNMAVAMAWEAIEQSCRERTSADAHPLDYYPPQED